MSSSKKKGGCTPLHSGPDPNKGRQRGTGTLMLRTTMLGRDPHKPLAILRHMGLLRAVRPQRWRSWHSCVEQRSGCARK